MTALFRLLIVALIAVQVKCGPVTPDRPELRVLVNVKVAPRPAPMESGDRVKVKFYPVLKYAMAWTLTATAIRTTG
jgi:hypothetical protein